MITEEWNLSGPLLSFVYPFLRRAIFRKKVRAYSKKETYEQKAEALILPIVEAQGFELVDVEYVKEGSNYYRELILISPRELQ